MWCRTPAVVSAASKLRPAVSKNSSTAWSSHCGAFARSTTTWAPFSTSASPSPVRVLTPEEGDAATTSWPRARRLFTTLVPISRVPPITTIFMLLYESAFEEREQIGIDDVCVRRDHAVRQVFVGFQRAVLEKLG